MIVALEVASLPAFALVGIRQGDKKSSEAALKFFLSSVTATAVNCGCRRTRCCVVVVPAVSA